MAIALRPQIMWRHFTLCRPYKNKRQHVRTCVFMTSLSGCLALFVTVACSCCQRRSKTPFVLCKHASIECESKGMPLYSCPYIIATADRGCRNSHTERLSGVAIEVHAKIQIRLNTMAYSGALLKWYISLLSYNLTEIYIILRVHQNTPFSFRKLEIFLPRPLPSGKGTPLPHSLRVPGPTRLGALPLPPFTKS